MIAVYRWLLAGYQWLAQWAHLGPSVRYDVHMRALTIRQPWAGLIALGVKDVENRTWRAPDDLIGGRFAIHAGRWDDDQRVDGLDVDTSHELAHTRGYVIATVRLVDVVDDHWSRWAARGMWHWVLEDARIVADPPFRRGQQGLWTP